MLNYVFAHIGYILFKFVHHYVCEIGILLFTIFCFCCLLLKYSFILCRQTNLFRGLIVFQCIYIKLDDKLSLNNKVFRTTSVRIKSIACKSIRLVGSLK